MALSQEQIQKLRTQAGLSPTLPTVTQSNTNDIIAKRKAALGIQDKPEIGVKPSFKASIGGYETVIPNVAKTFLNIPSSTANLLELGLVEPARKIQESQKLVGDIYKDQGFVQGTKDIVGGFADTLTKIGEAPGKLLVGNADKVALVDKLKPIQEQALKDRDALTQRLSEANKSGDKVRAERLKVALQGTIDNLDSINAQIGTKEERFNKEISDYTAVAKYPIERPLDIPLALETGGPKSNISRISSPVTRGADTSLSNVVSKSKNLVDNSIRDIVKTKQPAAINELEQTYTEIMSGTTPGKKKIAKIDTKTEALNRAGTTGKTPMRTLAEEGIIPNQSGTKLDTFEQAEQYRETIKPLREANRAALEETGLSTAPLELETLKARAIEYAKTPDNINAGRFDSMAKEIEKEFDLLLRHYPNGKIPLKVVDDIKSARWDNVFKNKGLVEADALKKNSEYAIAKSLQKSIEETVATAGNAEVAQLNRVIGDKLEAAKFLEDLNGKTVKGGRLLKYTTTIIGSSMGQSLPGKLVGALGGNMVGNLIISNTIASPIKRLILKNLKVQDPEAYTKTLEWLSKQKLDRETRLLLTEGKPGAIPMGGETFTGGKVDASGNPIIPKQGGAESVDALKNPVSVDPKTGKFQTTYSSSQSKSPTNQQTSAATTNDANISDTISQTEAKVNTPEGTIFTSPNIKEGAQSMNYEAATKALSGSEHARLKSVFDDIAKKSYPDATTTSAVGGWADGAEDTVITRIKDVKSLKELEKIGAKQGIAADQKGVINFFHNPKGPDSMYTIAFTKESKGDIIKVFKDNGIEYYTNEGNKFHIYDEGSKLQENINKVAEHYGKQINRTKGEGSFTGSFNSRAEGKKEFQKILDSGETAERGNNNTSSGRVQEVETTKKSNK